MSPHEKLLRDMARCPDLFGHKLCRLIQRDADTIQAARMASL